MVLVHCLYGTFLQYISSFHPIMHMNTLCAHGTSLTAQLTDWLPSFPLSVIVSSVGGRFQCRCFQCSFSVCRSFPVSLFPESGVALSLTLPLQHLYTNPSIWALPDHGEYSLVMEHTTWSWSSRPGHGAHDFHPILGVWPSSPCIHARGRLPPGPDLWFSAHLQKQDNILPEHPTCDNRYIMSFGLSFSSEKTIHIQLVRASTLR